MTLPVLERSTFDGAPVHFYEFTTATAAWRWTNAEVSLPFLSWTFEALQISHAHVKESEERASRDLVIYVPRDNPLVAALIAGTIGVNVEAKIYGSHRGISEADLLWRGRVAGAATGGSQAEIRCSGLNAYTDRLIPRLAISRTCPLMLYEPQCGVVRSSYTFNGTVTAVSGADVTVSGVPNIDPLGSPFDPTFYLGGILTHGADTAYIEQQADDVMTLLNPIPLEVGDAVQLTAGCDRTFETCRARFGNSKRFLGFKFLPIRNPFSGRLD